MRCFPRKSDDLCPAHVKKIRQLSEAGIDIVERLPLITEPTEYSKAYIDTKAKRSGHLFGDLAETHDVDKIRSLSSEDTK